jgi:hypothetical protein
MMIESSMRRLCCAAVRNTSLVLMKSKCRAELKQVTCESFDHRKGCDYEDDWLDMMWTVASKLPRSVRKMFRPSVVRASKFVNGFQCAAEPTAKATDDSEGAEDARTEDGDDDRSCDRERRVA